MSEVSDNLHFWEATPRDVKRFALAAEVAGRIVASNERWTTFVPLEDDAGTSILLAAPVLGLRWTYFEDFGLGLAFFDAGAELGRLELGWQDAPLSPVLPNLMEVLRNKGVTDSFASLEQLARAVSAGTCAPRLVRDRAAALLGLPAYEWLSPRYCRDTPLDEIQRLYPNAEDLDEL